MEASRADLKQKGVKDKVKKEAATEVEDMEDDEFLGTSEDDRKKRSGGSGGGKKGSGGGGASSMRCCQAEKCTADLSDAKQYHRRHKVCEHHAKAQVVVVAGLPQRFCQQCSRFHEISEFDEAKRSCRRRLAGHNERRRKNSADSHADSSSSRKGTGTGTQLKDLVCGQVDDRGRIQITIQENATYKHFQIR
ncbi:unnamed protein product [Ilex paraguariensis]|uniref:SBP-type domain-containing protein n=1 Tax=Ilex paraguariensis TaxID=185542 RepID=A0ABC8R5Z4_9AQUA